MKMRILTISILSILLLSIAGAADTSIKAYSTSDAKSYANLPTISISNSMSNEYYGFSYSIGVGDEVHVKSGSEAQAPSSSTVGTSGESHSEGDTASSYATSYGNHNLNTDTNTVGLEVGADATGNAYGYSWTTVWIVP